MAKTFTSLPLPVDGGLPLSSLKDVDLGGCKNVTDESVCAFLRLCPELCGLSLAGNRQLGDRVAAALVEFCPKILRVDLSESCISNFGLLTLVTGLGRHLNELSMYRCTGTTGGGVAAAVEHLSALNTISIGRIPGVGDEVMTALVTHCPRLVEVWAPATDVTDAGVLFLSSLFGQLTTICLLECREVTLQAALAIARECPRLTRYLHPSSAGGSTVRAALANPQCRLE